MFYEKELNFLLSVMKKCRIKAKIIKMHELSSVIIEKSFSADGKMLELSDKNGHGVLSPRGNTLYKLDVGFGVSYIFTELFWDNSITQHLGLAAFCWWLYGILIVALITLFSTVFSSFGGVILGVGGVIFTESLISIIPTVIEYLPTNLMGGASLVYGLSEPKDYIASIIITAVIIIAAFAASVPIFNKKQI